MERHRTALAERRPAPGATASRGRSESPSTCPVISTFVPAFEASRRARAASSSSISRRGHDHELHATELLGGEPDVGQGLRDDAVALGQQPDEPLRVRRSRPGGPRRAARTGPRAPPARARSRRGRAPPSRRRPRSRPTASISSLAVPSGRLKPMVASLSIGWYGLMFQAHWMTPGPARRRRRRRTCGRGDSRPPPACARARRRGRAGSSAPSPGARWAGRRPWS